ncbi:hypothetical protein PV11_01466 [Exophiala sideris]|uniref:Zn(2)-C6 fungal-type domain-containing protein n=1 Tax=Exophiala sideris TaxID=1016849 RepID=A0A0D1WAG0_9EURO|nr:hypothetical protein PV11_01466 [Exophiala sideris]
MADASSQLSSSATKRPRPVISCLECRRKKLKCDRTHPCQQCIKIGRPGQCEYQSGVEPLPNIAYALASPAKRQRIDSPPVEALEKGTVALNGSHGLPVSPAARGVIEDLQERVARLENAVLAGNTRHDESENPAAAAPMSPEANGSHSDEETAPLISHPLKSLFKDACLFISHLQEDIIEPETTSLRKDLRTIHYSVEMNNHRLWHQPATPQLLDQQPFDLPSFHICEKLATLYFDNMEHCFRVLHYPSFRRQLKILFTDGLGKEACSFGFLPQLIGVLAFAVTIGTYPECVAAASYAILERSRALEFMSNFLSTVKPRLRYTLPVMQTKSLLLICKWAFLEPIDDLFGFSGEILRDALVMKLSEDPSKLSGVGIFEGELRRRLWMSIMETDLMLSLLCKMPCMVPAYTAKPPQNINDDEIFEDIESLPQSRPMEEWTDGLCQYVLSQSFPRRLSACKETDGTTHIRFADIRHHLTYLEKILQELPSPLRFTYQGDQASKTPPRLLARMELDFSIRRPLMHLYTCAATTPYLNDIQRECTDGFVQSCLMITTFQDLFDPRYSEIDVPEPEGYWDFFHNLYRMELGLAILGLCLEIKKLASLALMDGGPQQPGAPRSAAVTKTSLIHSVQDTLEPLKLRLSHIGGNFKDLVYFTIVLTSLLPEQPGQNKEAMIRETLQALVRECQSQLRKDNVPIVAVPDDNYAARESAPANGNGAFAGIGAYDPSWSEFPSLDIFEPLDQVDLSIDRAT